MSFLCFSPKLRRRARRSRMATLLVAAFVLICFITPFYIIYKPPHWMISYFQQHWPDVLWQVPISEKIIALTIDDAPSEYTPEIRDVLKQNEASATFFVIGTQADGREDMLQDLVRDGHELGNHAMYDEAAKSLPISVLTEQIWAVEKVIHDAYGAIEQDKPPKYFRPGSGFFSARMRDLMAKLDYRMVMGGIYPHDPQIHFPGVNARHILSMLRPGGIIICHDRRGWTAPMLRIVLPEIRRQGYKITTVTNLLKSANS